MEPLRIFGIPISGYGYYMDCFLTWAQVELLAMDTSVVDYRNKKKFKDKTKQERMDEILNREANPNSVRKAAEEWKEKYGNGQQVQIDFSNYVIPTKKGTQRKYTLQELKNIEENGNTHTADTEVKA